MLTASPWTIKDSEETDYIENLGWSSPEHFMPEPKGRYLLLGCSNGHALNDTARKFPHMQFVGVDWNQKYIDEANRSRPNNVEYHCMSFEAFAKSNCDEFDAVVMHGVWSFIRDKDRLAICEILQTSVKFGGLVKISYDNALWWNLRRVVRDMAIYYGCQFNGDIDAVLKHLEGLRNTKLYQENREVRVFLEDVFDIEGVVKHWIQQPDWRPFYPFEIECILQALGYSLVKVLGEEERDPIRAANSDARELCEVWKLDGDVQGN